MQNETNPPDHPTQEQCTEVVKSLVQAGNPDSNLWAICIICNAEGDAFIAANGVNTVNPLQVAKHAQECMDDMWKMANREN